MRLRIFAFFILFIIKIRFPRTKTLIQVIHDRYNEETVRQFRKLEKLEKKLSKIACDLSFLNKCARFNLRPRFLNFRLYRRDLERSPAYRDFQRDLLFNEITSKEKQQHKITRQRDETAEGLSKSILWLDYDHLISVIERTVHNYTQHHQFVHNKKLNALGLRTPNDTSSDTASVNSVYNFSDYTLTPREYEILSRGLKYVIGPRKPSYARHFLEMEKLLYQISGFQTVKPEDDNKRSFFSKFKILAHSYYRDIIKYYNADYNLSISDHQTLKNLAKNKDIVIIKLDKGNGAVVMNRSDYVTKMNDILVDTSKFEKLNADPAVVMRALEDKINRLLRTLKKESVIDEATYKKVFSSGAQPGLLYGLAKVHKLNTPMRPILSAVGTFNYELAKHLVPIFAPLTYNDYTVRDSFSFAKEIVNMKFPGAHISSFDVVSLYTNIPLDESIEICTRDTLRLNFKGQCYDQSSLKSMLKMATKENVFLFNDSLYKQKDGVAMGSPLGPTIANSFLTFHEQEWLENCPLEFRPIYYRRYIDDTFIIFKDRAHSDRFLDYLNQQHRSIKFTKEDERDKKLAFLDVDVTKNEDGTFSTSVYRKPTNTRLIGHYTSYVPSIYKDNVISTLVDRAWKICSSYKALDNELNYLSTLFFENGYPLERFWKKCNKVIDGLYLHRKEIPTVPKAVIYHSIQYFGPITDMYKVKFKSLVNSYYGQVKLQIAHKNHLTVGSFFRVKDSIPCSQRSKVVYKYTCDVCKASYIGKTMRTLATRIAEHSGMSIRTGNLLSSPPYSAIREHLETHGGVRVNPSNFKVFSNG